MMIDAYLSVLLLKKIASVAEESFSVKKALDFILSALDLLPITQSAKHITRNSILGTNWASPDSTYCYSLADLLYSVHHKTRHVCLWNR